MKVVITGGTGFLGLRLARAILDRGTLRGASGAPESVDKMILLDAFTPAERSEDLDARVEIISSDISDRDHRCRSHAPLTGTSSHRSHNIRRGLLKICIRQHQQVILGTT